VKKLPLILTILGVVITSREALAVVRVASSIPDLASIASYIGGDRVSAFSVTRGQDNAHNVEVLPSYMIKVAKADVYLKVGLALDQWAPLIIDGSRNRKLKVVDCSMGVNILELPTGRVSAEQGDVHPNGNPHYWIDPENAAIVAMTIADALGGVDPEGAKIYHANATRFADECAKRTVEWRRRLAQATTHPVVTYHRSWIYFTNAFGFKNAGYVEPIPGIPPTATHLKHIVDVIKGQGVKLVIQESFYPGDAGEFIARQTGAKVITLDVACDGTGSNDYFDHLEEVVEAVEAVR